MSKRLGIVAALIWITGIYALAAIKPEPQSAPCEGLIKVELRQVHYSLNVWKHAKDWANAVEFQLPVSCQFYDKVSAGSNLLDHDNFRLGSFLIYGSAGSWSLKVTDKLGKK